MTVLSMHALGQMRHIDLVARALEAGVVPSDEMRLHLGSQSKEQLLDVLTRPEASAELARRAGSRLAP